MITARQSEVIAMNLCGASYAEIGRKLRITGQRVRQILKDHERKEHRAREVEADPLGSLSVRTREAIRNAYTIYGRDLTFDDVALAASDIIHGKMLHAYAKKSLGEIRAAVGATETKCARTEYRPNNEGQRARKMDVNPMLTTQQAAAHIDKSVSWLNKSRMTREGPPYLKIGGAVRYTVPDLDNWLAGKRRTAIYDFAEARHD